MGIPLSWSGSVSILGQSELPPCVPLPHEATAHCTSWGRDVMGSTGCCSHLNCFISSEEWEDTPLETTGKRSDSYRKKNHLRSCFGASRENASRRGEAGTTAELAPGSPIPCGQQGALEVLGRWRSPLGLPGTDQPSSQGWGDLKYLPGLSGAGEVQRRVETLVRIRHVSVRLNFVLSPKL